MAIEVRQLTINTSISPGDEQSRDVSNANGDSTPNQQALSDPCLNMEEMKADILAECLRLIRSSAEMKRDR